MDIQATKMTWAIDPVHSKIRFDAKYLLITSVSGWFREIEGTVVSTSDDFTNSEISLTIYAHSLFTGIEQRDDHLRSSDFFDAARYPTISFRSTKVDTLENSFRISGNLLIKDISQAIVFDARYLGAVPDPMGNTKAGFEMDIVFDRKDFNITWNQFFDKNGILIGDQVKIHADIQLLKLGQA